MIYSTKPYYGGLKLRPPLALFIIHNTATTPFYFTRGGFVGLDTGSLKYVGAHGDYWSNTAATADSTAYHLDFNSADTLPSYSNARWVGFSVRLGLLFWLGYYISFSLRPLFWRNPDSRGGLAPKPCDDRRFGRGLQKSA